MYPEHPRRWWPAIGIVAGCGLFVHVNASAADPLDASVAVPPVLHRSSLPEARGAAADKPLTWREANDTVGRIGGWRAYAREAAAPDPAAAAQPASGAAASSGKARESTPMPHVGHDKP